MGDRKLNPDMPSDELRLHMGELTPDEVLVARAAIRWANSQISGEWKTIDTAPKDGTKIFLYVNGESLYPTVGHYNSKERFLEDYGDADYMEEGWYWSFGYPSDFHEDIIFPTHWMPLPDAPTNSKDES